jgi:Zn-finger nucleic acid-binding protein
MSAGRTTRGACSMPDRVTVSVPALESRLPCPVCLGVQMEKVRFGKAPAYLTVDHCARCGGVWFEKGEPQRLALFPPSALAQHIPPRTEPPVAHCHGCHAPLSRDAERCGACGTNNVIDCPACTAVMQRRVIGTLVLDLCTRCKGVWFDHAELSSVWSVAIANANLPRATGRRRGAGVAGDALLESLFWAPDLTVHAGAAVVQGVGHAIGSVSVEGAAHLALGAAEGLGSAAEGVFGFVLEMLGGLFDS